MLGVFDGVPRPASIALRALGAGEDDAARRVLNACESFGRTVFEAPTDLYKCGLAFLAYVNGVQDVFDLPNHLHVSRTAQWYARVLQTASACGALTDVKKVAERVTCLD